MLVSGSAVKNLPAVQELWEMWVQSLGGKDPLEEEMTTYSSILAWEILPTEQSGGLQSMGSQSQTQLNAHACMLYMNNLSSTIVCYKLYMLSII